MMHLRLPKSSIKRCSPGKEEMLEIGIHGGKICTAGGEEDADIGISGGKIIAIEKGPKER